MRYVHGSSLVYPIPSHQPVHGASTARHALNPPGEAQAPAQPVPARQWQEAEKIPSQKSARLSDKHFLPLFPRRARAKAEMGFILDWDGIPWNPVRW